MGYTADEGQKRELEPASGASLQSADGEKRASAAEACVQDAKLVLPEGHRVPEGATILEGEDEGRCRVVKVAGSRCKAARVRGMRLCSGHAGLGGVNADPSGAALQANAAKARIRARRQLLGIGPRRAADPRQVARLEAHERAEQLAAALVIGPLEDPNLSTLQRQAAAVTILDQTFPLQTATVEVEIPAEGVSGLGWADMQALAARLLEE